MIQLSSSPSEFIPVSQGTEKNNAPTIKDDGFKTALREQQELSRESELSQVQESRVAESSEADGNNLRTEGREKAAQETASSDWDTRRSEKLSKSDKSEKQTKAGKPEKAEAEDSAVLAKKSSKSPAESSVLHLVKGGEKVSEEKTLTALEAKKSRSSGPAAMEAAELASAASAGAGASAAEKAADLETAGAVMAEDTEAGLAQKSSESVDVQVQSAGDSALSQLAEEAVKNAEETPLQQAALAQKAAARDNGKTAKSDEKKKSQDLKIAVEDRRSAKEQAPLLRRVEENSEGNKLTLELTPSSDDVTTAMPVAENADASGKSFALMSAEEQKGAALQDRQLQDKGTQELTKSIRFVLKDNKEGEIKLILKPEALGKVRINLNLNENNIVGKIIVENSNVRQVFLNNLADLTRSLEESGFNTASLDVSVGGGQAEQGSQHRQESPVYFTSSELDELDGQIPVVYEENMNLGRIDLVV